MNLTGSIIIFMTAWFLALFLVLPIGQRTQADMEDVTPGTPSGAPYDLRLMGRKMIIATIISIIVLIICDYIVSNDIITRESMSHWDQLIRR